MFLKKSIKRQAKSHPWHQNDEPGPGDPQGLCQITAAAFGASHQGRLDTRRERRDISGRAVLIKALALFEILVELAFGSILENEVDSRLVVKIAVQAKNVVVPQM